MNYKVTDRYVEVTITNKDIDKNCTEENIYEHMPKEVKEFIYKNKLKSNFRETRISGKYTPYQPDSKNLADGVTFIFELT